MADLKFYYDIPDAGPADWTPDTIDKIYKKCTEYRLGEPFLIVLPDGHQKKAAPLFRMRSFRVLVQYETAPGFTGPLRSAIP